VKSTSTGTLYRLGYIECRCLSCVQEVSVLLTRLSNMRCSLTEVTALCRVAKYCLTGTRHTSLEKWWCHVRATSRLRGRLCLSNGAVKKCSALSWDNVPFTVIQVFLSNYIFVQWHILDLYLTLLCFPSARILDLLFCSENRLFIIEQTVRRSGLPFASCVNWQWFTQNETPDLGQPRYLPSDLTCFWFESLEL